MAAAQLLAGMDRSADPCEDFYRYACGQWDQRHVIPEDEHSYNTFEKLHDELQIILRRQYCWVLCVCVCVCVCVLSLIHI